MVQRQAAQRTALITGASSGIGRATARLFAGKGFRVFGTSRRQQPDEDGIEMLQLDVRSDDSIHRAVEEVIARAGRVDVLINNAGVLQFGLAEETTMEEVRSVFETNYFGPVRVVKAVLPHMRASRNGRIINVGSLAAWVGEPGEASYSASKAALARFSEALHHEAWPLGIHVSLVEPAAFKTRVLEKASVSGRRIDDYNLVRNASHIILQESLRKGGDPRRVARLILKVALSRSPRFRYGTGRGSHLVPYLKVLLPQRCFDSLLRRAYGISKRVVSR